MKEKTRAAVLAAALLPGALTLAGCSLTKEPAELVQESPRDFRTYRTVFRLCGEDGLREYLVVGYGGDTHKLVSLTDEVYLAKQEGFLTTVDEAALAEEFPSFAVIDVAEDESVVRVSIRMDGLDGEERLRQMEAAGVLELGSEYAGGPANGDHLFDALREDGAPELTYEEYRALEVFG